MLEAPEGRRDRERRHTTHRPQGRRARGVVGCRAACLTETERA